MSNKRLVFLGEEKLKKIRDEYPIGTRIKLLRVPEGIYLDEYDRGTVEFVSSEGAVFCTWDDGTRLGLYPWEDKFTLITEKDDYEVLCQKLREVEVGDVIAIIIDDLESKKYLKTKKGFIDISFLNGEGEYCYVSIKTFCYEMLNKRVTMDCKVLGYVNNFILKNLSNTSIGIKRFKLESKMIVYEEKRNKRRKSSKKDRWYVR